MKRPSQVPSSAGFIAPSFTASSKPLERKHGRGNATEATTWMWATASYRTLLSAVEHNHDKKSGTNFYLHWQTAQSYLMPDEVVVQLWVSENSKLCGGQRGRYCSTCPAGIRNDKISIPGIHIPVMLLAPGQPDPNFRPTPTQIMTQITSATPLEENCEVVVTWPYSGKNVQRTSKFMRRGTCHCAPESASRYCRVRKLVTRPTHSPSTSTVRTRKARVGGHLSFCSIARGAAHLVWSLAWVATSN